MRRVLGRVATWISLSACGSAWGWSEEQICTYIEERRHVLRNRIPGSCTPGLGLQPATFLFAVTLVVDGSEFVAHHWSPADGRGVVAVAYSPATMGDDRLERAARVLLKQLPDVSAVAMPTGDVISRPH